MEPFEDSPDADQIKAEVQISTSGIENFALSGGKGSARIDTRGVCSLLEALKRIFWDRNWPRHASDKCSS
jgi:hypothetical protein